MRASPQTRSLLRARIAGVAPRAALYGAVAILALAGIRAIVRPQRLSAAAPPSAPARDLAAEAFAQSFVRAYLSWTAGDQDGYDSRVAGYLGSSLGADAELAVPLRGSQRVTWTQATADEPSGPRRRTIVVEAQASGPPKYVAVPVARDAAGAMFVSAYPAIVGPPASNPQASVPSEADVSDPDLETVARRAIGNYLSGQTSELRADLVAGAAVSAPMEPLALRSIDGVTWAAPGVVAVGVTAADPAGTVWTLRYELRVVKSDRWYVAAVELDPTKEGDS